MRPGNSGVGRKRDRTRANQELIRNHKAKARKGSLRSCLVSTEKNRMDRTPGAPRGPYGLAALPQASWPPGLYWFGVAMQPPQPGTTPAPEAPLRPAAPTSSAEGGVPRVEMPGLSEHACITHDAHNTRDAHDAHGRQDGAGRSCTTYAYKQTMHHSHSQERSSVQKIETHDW